MKRARGKDCEKDKKKDGKKIQGTKVTIYKTGKNYSKAKWMREG
jgi:hypothetical protein